MEEHRKDSVLHHKEKVEKETTLDFNLPSPPFAGQPGKRRGAEQMRLL